MNENGGGIFSRPPGGTDNLRLCYRNCSLTRNRCANRPPGNGKYDAIRSVLSPSLSNRIPFFSLSFSFPLLFFFRPFIFTLCKSRFHYWNREISNDFWEGRGKKKKKKRKKNLCNFKILYLSNVLLLSSFARNLNFKGFSSEISLP